MLLRRSVPHGAASFFSPASMSPGVNPYTQDVQMAVDHVEDGAALSLACESDGGVSGEGNA